MALPGARSECSPPRDGRRCFTHFWRTGTMINGSRLHRNVHIAGAGEIGSEKRVRRTFRNCDTGTGNWLLHVVARSWVHGNRARERRRTDGIPRKLKDKIKKLLKTDERETHYGFTPTHGSGGGGSM